MTTLTPFKALGFLVMAKCMPGRLLVFPVTAKSFDTEDQSASDDRWRSVVLFRRLKSALSVAREENDGAGRPLTCINK